MELIKARLGMVEPKKILIVGAGLGGITLAAFLEKTGHDYLVIDKLAPTQSQGYSLGIWSNTRDLLNHLQLDQQLNSMGTAIGRYDICDSRGRLLRHYDFHEFYTRYGMAYTQIRREPLRELIGSRVARNRIRWNSTFHMIANGGEKVEVELNPGERRQFDLVVGADGVHSALRESCFGPGLERSIGWRAFYARIDRSYIERGTMREYLGRGKCLGVFDDGDQALAIFFLACKPTTGEAIEEVDSHLVLNRCFQDEFADMGKRAGKRIDRTGCEMGGVIDGVEIMCTDLTCSNMRRWYRGRAVLLGDAAHAFEPHTGLGASMAMEDAYCLSLELEKISAAYPLDRALENYQFKRRRRLAAAQSLNRRIGSLAFIRSGIMRGLANQLVRCAPRQLFTRQYFQLFDSRITAG